MDSLELVVDQIMIQIQLKHHFPTSSSGIMRRAKDQFIFASHQILDLTADRLLGSFLMYKGKDIPRRVNARDFPFVSGDERRPHLAGDEVADGLVHAGLVQDGLSGLLLLHEDIVDSYFGFVQTN